VDGLETAEEIKAQRKDRPMIIKTLGTPFLKIESEIASWDTST
jgi:hypothetical protein